MGIALRVLWKNLVKLLRRSGWGGLLVPMAIVGMVLYGVRLWTVAAILVALVLAVWRPAATAGLLPVATTGGGLLGLKATAGPPPSWMSGGTLVLPGRFDVLLSWRPPGQPDGRPGYKPVTVQAPPAALPQLIHHANRLGLGPVPRQVVFSASGRPPGHSMSLAQALRSAAHLARTLASSSPTSTSSLWREYLLLPVSLLLLALGLLLAARHLIGLRSHLAQLGPYLRKRLRENYWGILLVPVTVTGLTVFGMHEWTIAAVAAAVAITVLWPAVAADLTPAVLTGFAVVGFIITATWESLTPNPNQATVFYGGVMIGTQTSAVLAGAEASVFLALAAWLVPRTIGAHVRALGAPQPDPELAGRVQRLTETREHAIDSANSELRRIERDLHDGAQARLVALGLNLRSVERLLPADPQAALALVGEARETSLRALAELRHLIRGIYPPVLADRGLAHAVRALALDTPVRTELDIDLPGRLAPPVESACYFAVAEALANAVKHAGARCVHIRIEHAAGLLRIEVSDDGVGGADLAGGTGLRGVERRLDTFDGILAVNSPAGGPTMIAMEVPCALSSPKTCSCSGTA